MKIEHLALPLFLAAAFATSIPGAAATPGTWYAALDKPSFTPPSWVFGPVWTTLYVLMGVAAWRVWRRAGFRGARVALGLYLAQLLVNAAWSPIFFGLKRMDVAFGVILLLLGLVIATTVAFGKHDRVAAWLLGPYIAWVSLASALNAALWTMNPASVGR